jgi:Lipocalin-like domain
VTGERLMVEGLRDQLIGAWKLVSYQERPVDGSEPFEPLGHEPKGIIMYTPDGYMSAQLSKPDRPNFASADWFAGTAEDYQAKASSYIACSGPFHVDEEKQTLTHWMFVSLFPDWTGQTQPRRVKLEGDTLRLGTASPIQSSGKTVNSELIWRRAESN